MPPVANLIRIARTISGVDFLRRIARCVLALAYRKQNALTNKRLEDALERIEAASNRDTQAWNAIQTLDDWKRFVEPRIAALRNSLGAAPSSGTVNAEHKDCEQGDGYTIERVIYESASNLIVTANLYQPLNLEHPAPGVVVCHSHHNDKNHPELNELGAHWARQGCRVLVIDLPGHGERRTHPFHQATDYAGEFPLRRQDYFFRYNLGIQLDLMGDSLMGWMVRDVIRGVELLLGLPQTDRNRIMVLGCVAGGGDIAAVASALDERITCVAAFNFGLPGADAGNGSEDNLAGSGSWESSRNLRVSARDGFPPWVVLSAVAPRKLVYAHEFGWEPDRDPVWQRLRKVYALHDQPDQLTTIHGSGSVTGHSAADTHCNNIGALHRRQLEALFQDWFTAPQDKLQPNTVAILVPEAIGSPRPGIVECAAQIGACRLAAVRTSRASLQADEQRKHLRAAYARLLGDISPAAGAESECTVPLTLLLPEHGKPGSPLVVGFAQGGHHHMHKQRRLLVDGLLANGVAVCLLTLHGMGETRGGDEYRGRRSLATEAAASELMLGEPALSLMLRDLRTALAWLRSNRSIDPSRIALWGDSLAATNSAQRDIAVPWDADPCPDFSEPAAGIAALLCALFEDVGAVCINGCLASYLSLLDSPFCYTPRDAVIPGALAAGDISDIAAALAPRPLRIEAPVDGLNRRAIDAASMALQAAQNTYTSVAARHCLTIDDHGSSPSELTEWFTRALENHPGKKN